MTAVVPRRRAQPGATKVTASASAGLSVAREQSRASTAIAVVRQHQIPEGANSLVHAGAITRNTAYFASLTQAEVMAVVKADGYGHGAVNMARAALAGGATWLGVTSLAEALELRGTGISSPILSWLNPHRMDAMAAAREGIDLAVSSLAQLTHIEEVMKSAPEETVARVHLHVDTGLARDGAAPREWDGLCTRARLAERSGLIRVVGIMSHLADADTPHHAQNAAARWHFEGAIRRADRAGLKPHHRHIAATSATVTSPNSHHTMVRIGAGLVGVDLSMASAGRLEAAMTLTAPVLMVRDVQPGTSVGYAGTWVARDTTRLATIQAGYADGVPRRLDSGAEVSINGTRCRIVGRVSMDQIVVNVGSAQVFEGDRAVLWGRGELGEPTVQEWAHWAGTIPHELLTAIGGRVSRSVELADSRGGRP